MNSHTIGMASKGKFSQPTVSKDSSSARHVRNASCIPDFQNDLNTQPSLTMRKSEIQKLREAAIIKEKTRLERQNAAFKI